MLDKLSSRDRGILMIWSVFVFGILQIFFGEKIPFRNGYGFDGYFYGTLAEDFFGILQNHEIPANRITRLLPVALVHLVLRVLRLEPNPSNVIRIFEFLNLIYLVSSVFLLNQIAAVLKWSARVHWIAFSGLLINFASLKFMFYYPVLTDSVAPFLGLASICAYLSKQQRMLLLLTVLGAFCWPTAVVGNVILLLFPWRAAGPARANPRLGTILAAIATNAFFIAIFLFGVLNDQPMRFGIMPIVREWLLPSMAIAAVFLFFGAKEIFQYFDRRLLSGLISRNTAQIVLVVAGVLIFQAWLARTFGAPSFGVHTLDDFIAYVLLSRAIAKPGAFLVAHVVYFGPVILLAVFFWKGICHACAERGPGLLLSLLFLFCFSLNSESRHLLFSLPVLVVVLGMTLHKRKVSQNLCWMILGLSLVFSKVWFPINREKMVGTIYEFPLQNYFMNQGPWMGVWAYQVQALAVISMAAVIFWQIRRERRRNID